MSIYDNPFTGMNLIKELEHLWGGIASGTKFIKPLRYPILREIEYKYPRGNRNKPCPCGSGKKFKNCCYNIIKGD